MTIMAEAKRWSDTVRQEVSNTTLSSWSEGNYMSKPDDVRNGNSLIKELQKSKMKNILCCTSKSERNLMTYKMIISMAKNLRQIPWQRSQKITKVPFSTSKQEMNMGTSSPEMRVNNIHPIKRLFLWCITALI